MAASVIKKYGLVPKYAMPETNSSNSTAIMNRNLATKVCNGGCCIIKPFVCFVCMCFLELKYWSAETKPNTLSQPTPAHLAYSNILTQRVFPNTACLIHLTL